MSDTAQSQDLPGHVDETVQAIARMHAAHARSATPAERMLETAVASLGRPAFTVLLTAFVVLWLGVDLWPGRAAFDPPPFSLLGNLLSLFALYMTVLILIVQRRSQRLGNHREQLMLQLALLSDQKTAKLIALIEELRRDDPLIRNRPDSHAEELTRIPKPFSKPSRNRTTACRAKKHRSRVSGNPDAVTTCRENDIQKGNFRRSTCSRF